MSKKPKSVIIADKMLNTQTGKSDTSFAAVFLSDLSLLIDTYKVRLSKIEKATNTISEWNQEKAFKMGAAKATKKFLSELRKMRKHAQPK